MSLLAFDEANVVRLPKSALLYKKYFRALWIEPKAVPRFTPWKITLVSHVLFNDIQDFQSLPSPPPPIWHLFSIHFDEKNIYQHQQHQLIHCTTTTKVTLALKQNTIMGAPTYLILNQL